MASDIRVVCLYFVKLLAVARQVVLHWAFEVSCSTLRLAIAYCFTFIDKLQYDSRSCDNIAQNIGLVSSLCHQYIMDFFRSVAVRA